MAYQGTPGPRRTPIWVWLGPIIGFILLYFLLRAMVGQVAGDVEAARQASRAAAQAEAAGAVVTETGATGESAAPAAVTDTEAITGAEAVTATEAVTAAEGVTGTEAVTATEEVTATGEVTGTEAAAAPEEAAAAACAALQEIDDALAEDAGELQAGTPLADMQERFAARGEQVDAFLAQAEAVEGTALGPFEGALTRLSVAASAGGEGATAEADAVSNLAAAITDAQDATTGLLASLGCGQ